MTRQPMDDERRYRDLLVEIRDEFPRFRLIRKDQSTLQRAIHVVLALVTLGGQRCYLSHFVTTLGQRVYVTPDWDRRDACDRYITLRHERVHLRQFARFGFVPMALLYLLVPFPFGVAWGRMFLEREAYDETLRATAEVHGHGRLHDAAYREHVVRLFTGGAYGWMWPFRRSVERWYDGCAAACRDRG